MKRVSHLRVGGKPIRSAEGVVLYLIKYLAKSFQMRENKVLSQKVGLLPGMGIYKIFRVIYGYENGQAFIQQKRKKPLTSSQVFINNEYGFQQEAEQEFSPYFDEKEHLKKDARKILQKREPQPTNNAKSSKTNSESRVILAKKAPEKKAKAEKSNKHILPNLSRIKLPAFTKFQDYQVQDLDFIKINEYEPLEEIGESADSQAWRDSVPTELIYNHIYLKEIRSQISGGYSWAGLSTDDAIKRYADY
ncbi:9674_t:CDS:2 [Racocetra persica]|uniref:9674_t:CDS:1 n=1 Tax=Racocetra persica TaxID=160502 RepID=A0ACA9PUD7_9GLOM|nr:9674_t:CDS:2 [Racocetra persica]